MTMRDIDWTEEDHEAAEMARRCRKLARSMTTPEERRERRREERRYRRRAWREYIDRIDMQEAQRP